MCQPHSPTVQIQLSLQLQKASGLVRSADTHAHIQIIHHHILWVVHLTCMGEGSIGMNRLSLLSQSDPYSLPLHWKACLVCLNMHTSPLAHCASQLQAVVPVLLHHKYHKLVARACRTCQMNYINNECTINRLNVQVSVSVSANAGSYIYLIILTGSLFRTGRRQKP